MRKRHVHEVAILVTTALLPLTAENQVLLEAGGLVVAAHLRVDPSGDHLGPEGAGCAGANLALEDHRDPVGAADIEMVADETFEERPPGLGPVEDAGVGHLELAERELVDIPVPQIGGGEQ
jgi:hypothetical protein